jgi:hypothetical protein
LLHRLRQGITRTNPEPRDGLIEALLRDNRVIPPVLALLSLLIFAWIAAGLLLNGSGEEQQPVSNQSAARAETAQGDGDTLAPETENRDTESYAAYGPPKDPFRQLIEPAANETTTGEATTGDETTDDTGDGSADDGSGGGSGGGNGDGTTDDGPTDDGAGGGGPGDNGGGGGSGNGPGDGDGSGGGGRGDPGSPGAGQDQYDDRRGDPGAGRRGGPDDDLFDSGGNLLP